MSGQITNDYQTLKAGAQALSQFGASLQQMGRQFKQIHRQLEDHCSGDESGIGAAVQEATSDVAEAGSEVFGEGGRVLSEMGSRTDTNTERMFTTDQTIADSFMSIAKEAPAEPAGPPATATPAGPSGKHSAAPASSPAGPSNDAVRPYGGPGGLEHDDPRWQQAMEANFPKDANGDFALHADPRTGWVADGNDGGAAVQGRGNNCADCSRSFMASWYGEPTCSQPRISDPTSGVDGPRDPERNGNSNIVNFAGASHRYEGAGATAGYQNVANRLQTAGPGSAAIVQVDWPRLDPATNLPYVDPKTGQPVLDPQTGRIPIDSGHAFNVVNVNGKIVWVDMQSNTVSENPINTQPDPVNVWSIALDSKGRPL